MDEDYDRRQHGDRWPKRGRWNPSDLPPWYRELLGDLADNLTAWRADDRDPHRLDPKCDPRAQPRQERRHANG